MDLEYLFEAALVALGPPYRMPRVTRDGVPTPIEKFNIQVGEYNAFVAEVHGLVMPEWSYEKFSGWFHDRR